MKRIGCLFTMLFFVLGVGVYAFWGQELFGSNQVVDEETIMSDKQETEENSGKQQSDDVGLTNSLFMQFIGRSSEDVIENFGQPIRKDKSPYGYTSYIYSDGQTYQIQFAVNEGNQVVMVYVIGKNAVEESINVGMDYDQLQRRFHFSNQVSLKTSDGLFDFELSDQDLLERPLIELNDMWVQLYFDRFTNELSSYRYLTKEVLLTQRPYSLTYRGKLEQQKELTEDEWVEVETGASQQVLEITNAIRHRHGLSPLKWEQETANVAYGHSRDMEENAYFSHVSPTEGELGERLKKGGIVYSMAAENIAANYVDAIAAVEGWLNSEGHRVNMLNDEFTYLGVGVYKKHYTQNFISKW